jgi:hypothetical protein
MHGRRGQIERYTLEIGDGPKWRRLARVPVGCANVSNRLIADQIASLAYDLAPHLASLGNRLRVLIVFSDRKREYVMLWRFEPVTT